MATQLLSCKAMWVGAKVGEAVSTWHCEQYLWQTYNTTWHYEGTLWL